MNPKDERSLILIPTFEVGDVVSLVYTKDRQFQILETTEKSIRLRALDEQDPDFWEPIPSVVVDLDDGA